MKYGPQTQEIEAFLEKLKTLTPEQVDELNAAWRDAVRVSAHDAAWGAALNAVRVSAHDAAWGAALNAVRVSAWVAARAAVLNAAWVAALNDAWVAALNDAWDAAWNAAWALLVKDLISEEHFNILYGPWKSVMED